MECQIICTGTELLLGETLNTNSQYLGCQFAKLGIDVYEVSTFGDSKGRLIEALKKTKSQLVFLNGGLGSTEDDVTREALSEFLGAPEIVHQRTLNKIEGFYRKRNKACFSGNKKVANVLDSTTVFFNEEGAALGLVIKKDNRYFFLTPGSPNELEWLFENKILPYLVKEFNLTETMILSKTIKIMGIGESDAENLLKDFIESNNPSLALAVKDGEIHFIITAKGDNIITLENLINTMKKKIYAVLGDYIFGENSDTLESVLGNLLLAGKKSVSVAESCTGGYLSNALTNIPGSSTYFNRGYVTYSNEAKMALLSVSKETLETYGSVSAEIASEMVAGVYKHTKSDICIATTGIAGPGGDVSIEKPVGLIYIGFYLDGNIIVIKKQFSGSRKSIKKRTVRYILFYLLNQIKRGK